MYNIGQVERSIYKLRAEHPLIIPQLDPDKYNMESAKKWFEEVKGVGIRFIAIGGSMVNTQRIQELLDIAIKDYDLNVALYLTNTAGALRGVIGKTAMYWMQVPTSLNTFYGWDGLISNALYLEKNGFESIPTVYVFDDRDFVGTANWITRSYPIPKEKPEISLAVAKAAQYLGIRFYIMAGGSGSINPPPVKHVEYLTKHSSLFVIPTSGINTPDHVKILFSAGADGIHVGNRLEREGGFKILEEMVMIAEQQPGKKFI